MAGFMGFQNGKFSLDSFLHSISGPLAVFFNRAYDKKQTENTNNALKDRLKQQYPNLSDDQLNKIINEYGDTSDANWYNVFSAGKDTSDYDSARDVAERLSKAYAELGEMPSGILSENDLERIRQDAYSKIDEEFQGLKQLYDESFNKTEDLLNTNLIDNQNMFRDYRNQVLTNQAMSQQAIAGSTRFELDRQQRNAISRGASAAQRLVANINTSLGTQAQSAQQALDTSNALAQNLLAHRQAQQNLRNSYIDAQNQHTANIANLTNGLTERKENFARNQITDAKQNAVDNYNAWVDKRDDYFRGDSLGSTLYGRGKSNAI